MADVAFSSINPYQTLEVIEANSPKELVKMLKEIKTPIKIVQITSFGTMQIAYIMGDIRKPIKKNKGD